VRQDYIDAITLITNLASDCSKKLDAYQTMMNAKISQESNAAKKTALQQERDGAVSLTKSQLWQLHYAVDYRLTPPLSGQYSKG